VFQVCRRGWCARSTGSELGAGDVALRRCAGQACLGGDAARNGARVNDLKIHAARGRDKGGRPYVRVRRACWRLRNWRNHASAVGGNGGNGGNGFNTEKQGKQRRNRDSAVDTDMAALLAAEGGLRSHEGPGNNAEHADHGGFVSRPLMRSA
jgi:hypothetical protein